MSIKIRKDVMKQMRVKIYNKVAKILLGIFKIPLVVIYVLVECLTIYEIMAK